MGGRREEGVGSVNLNPATIRVLEICHEKAHEVENDPEDYLFLSVTERETWLLLMGMILAGAAAPCMLDDLKALEQKIAESIKAQKPAWREGHGLDEA